jgi:hypothetical protein
VLREIFCSTAGIIAYEARFRNRKFLTFLIGKDLKPIRKYPALIHYGHYDHAKMVIPCICALDPVSRAGVLLEINLINYYESINQDPKGEGVMAVNKLRGIFLLGLLIIATFGCASGGRYQVQVNGYTDSAAPLLAPGASLFVIEDQKAQNPPLEKEIKDKIENLLVKHGYLLTPYDKAQFYLFYTYGLETSGTVTVAGPIGPGRGWEGFGYSAYLPAKYGPYAMDTLTLYDRWLGLTVVEGQYYRETGKSRTVWVGEARSTGTSSDIREVLSPLLIAAFEQFGKNTGRALPTSIQQNDPRVRELEGIH